jgi:hypothetical protein
VNSALAIQIFCGAADWGAVEGAWVASEELVEADPSFEYNVWLIKIDGQQVKGGW